MTGTPMSMIRLQGCTVECPWCDTKESWSLHKGTQMDEEEIVAAIQDATFAWALVSGGEPLTQDLATLSSKLKMNGFYLALETSGTEDITGTWDFVVVSPKQSKPLVRATIFRADEIKMVVGGMEDIHFLETEVLPLSRSLATISLQPKSLGEVATRLCYDICLERGWRLSLQTHKFVGMD